MYDTYVMFIDPKYSFEDRKRIGNAAIKYIVNRTKSGRGVGNKLFGQYSKSYTETDEFEIAGKKPGKVNLTLTGDMLDSIEILDASLAGRIIIGFSSDDEKNKAQWMFEKGYDFLGLTVTEKNLILSEFKTPIGESRIVESISPSFTQGLLRRLIGG